MRNNKKTEIIFVENEDRQSRLANLQELLSYKFIIPDFQRPYAWDENHFQDLLNSIKENKENENRETFLGSIIVAIKKNQSSTIPGKQKYMLIDGQQRITSFLVLLKFILNELENYIEKNKENIKNIQLNINKAEKDGDTKNLKKYLEEKIHEENKGREYREHIDKVKNILDSDRIKRESQNPSPLEESVLNYTLGNNKGAQNTQIKRIENVFDQEIENFDIIDLLKYILSSCIFCFLTIIGDDSEDYAIDIFNSLNSTGEPLTAFEILKSLIHKKFSNNITIQKNLTKMFNDIERELDKKKIKKIKQNKYTDRLILFLNMMEKDLQLEKTTTFREKKKILDKITSLSDNKAKECVETIYDLHKFILNNWENRKNRFDKLKINYEAKILFDFLQSFDHYMVLPIFYHFKDSSNLDVVIKKCVAFTCLWRGSSPNAGTDRIDTKYTEIIKILSQSQINIKKLDSAIFQIVGAEKNKKPFKKEQWLKKFKDIDIYKQRKIARLLLFIAFHNRDFDQKNQILKKAQLKFLTFDNWNDKNYKTIEHIIPQSYEAIHKIGNLILLPQKINNKAGNKKFSDKRKIYNQCLNKDPSEMPYIPVLKEIVSYKAVEDLTGDNHLSELAIDKRGKRLGESIWQTLAEDWLGWKD